MCPTDVTNKILINGDYTQNIIWLLDRVVSDVSIMMFDWNWYKNDFACDISLINQSIIRAKRRGVKIRIISNAIEAKTYFLQNGIDVRKYSVRGVFHAKLFIFDQNKFVIGSHNMTMGAMSRNFEVSYLSNDNEAAKAFVTLFDSIWQ